MAGDSNLNSMQLDDCWNRIGTWGKETPRCERLTEVGHCSKCDVYRGAGRLLLKRPAPQGYLEQWREFLAAKPNSGSSSGRFFVLFELGGKLYALPASALEQVADAAPIRTLPHNRRAGVLGVVNIRGDVLPCADLAALLKLHTSEANRSAASCRRMLVAKPGAARWVLPAEQVVGLQRLDMPTLNAGSSPGESLLNGSIVWDERNVHVIDVEGLARSLEGLAS